MENTSSQRVRLQYRPYSLDPDFPVFAFIGQNKPLQPLPEVRTGAYAERYMHLHNCIEITCVTCDTARLYVENDMHIVHRGDVIIIFPFTSHFLTEEGQQTSCDYLYFDPAMLLTSFMPGQLTRFSFFCERRSDCIILPGMRHEEIRLLIRHILRELSTQDAEYRPYVSSLLVALMVEMMRSQSTLPDRPQPSAPSLLSIMPAVQHINDAYMQPITLQQLQKLCHLSGTQLRRVFHSVMGCAPLAYIQQVRIGHACDLMLSSRTSLTEIASSVGFDSISSFHRQFVRYHGCSASQWRKEHAMENTRHLPASPYRAE